MYQYDPASNCYRITIQYHGKEYRYRLQQYHSEIGATYWHLFANGRLLDLKLSGGKLEELLLSGQQPSPPDFIQLLQEEMRSF